MDRCGKVGMKAKAEQLLQRGPSVSGSLLPAILAIFRPPPLTGAQQMTVPGLSKEKTRYNCKRQPEKATLTRDLLERAGYILAVYKSLELLLPGPGLADPRLATPEDSGAFNGSAPIERMLAWQMVDLAAVRNFLAKERGVW